MVQDSFGQAVVSSNSVITNNLRFSSQYYDEESGLHYNTQRYYDPVSCRYISRDPIGENSDINLYSFVGNSAIVLVDYWGLEEKQYDYSIFFGAGAPQGNDVIANAHKTAVKNLSRYTAPKGATKKCKVTIFQAITSREFRDASKNFNELHFFGHGDRRRFKNPDYKEGRDPVHTAWIDEKRTYLTFRDSYEYLSDVLTVNKGKVKTHLVTPWVCFDKYVDDYNPSGVQVVKRANETGPIQSFILNKALADITRNFQNKKCCSVDIYIRKY